MIKFDYLCGFLAWILIFNSETVTCHQRIKRLLLDDINHCPIGHFCPNGSSYPFPCPVGTFNNLIRQTSCQVCLPGVYCPSEALYVGLMCPVGHFCPVGSSAPIQCAEGSFNRLTGQSSCIVCPVGHMCPTGVSSPIICPAGSYNNLTGQSACFDCPAGYYCTLSSNKTEINVCPSTMYCPPGSAQPTICPAGTFNSLIGQGSCNICPVGFFCPSGSSQATLCPAGTFFDQTNGKAITDCIQCPKGHYCPMGSVQSIACPVGTILSLTGAASVSECKVCPCGFYCDSTGLEQPTGNCDSGYYCSGGSSSPRPTDGVTGNRCSKDYACPEGSCMQM
ncbi:signal peptide, CUB and EGF-like domain-containing protein 2 [Ruditapes philippinarum]|uniref:signal peptide, CUB and EGF-like domain-containing protein 2 n=1 Tax=Ruditapes philippinarum TaxID=129788 RepID=UPI00295BD53D|nr:signal peptide, CUB and EGF-like domain-containing protein 2 [Ruditapes philippinarum]